ncbi:MAG: transglutaminase domain-containing protein [Pseudomonadales bacterium]
MTPYDFRRNPRFQQTRRRFAFGLGVALAAVGLGACGRTPTRGAWSSYRHLPPIDEPVVLSGDAGDRPIIAAVDPTNPLHIFRVPVTRRIEFLAEQLAHGTASIFEFFERSMTYIDGFKVGFASDATPDATVLERVGACGTFSGTLLALCRCHGIEGRYINFHNYPENNGHTVCELLIAGQWMLFDPTTHIYYSAKSIPGAQPLAYEGVRDRYLAGAPVYRNGGNTRSGRDLYSGADIFLKADPQGVIGPSRALRFPLKLHLTERPVVTRPEFGTTFQGAVYIGAAGTNHEHRWDLQGLVPGNRYRFGFKPKWLGGDLSIGDSTFRIITTIEGGSFMRQPPSTLDFSTGTAESWSTEFEATCTSIGQREGSKSQDSNLFFFAFITRFRNGFVRQIRYLQVRAL